MIAGPIFHSRRNPVRSVSRTAACDSNQPHLGMAKTLYRQLPSAITYDADDAYRQLMTPYVDALCPSVLNCCSSPFVVCRRCLRTAYQNSKTPWKILLLLLLLLSGVQMLANMTFYRHSNSLFFFNLSNPLEWHSDGRPVFRERWMRLQSSQLMADVASSSATASMLQSPSVNRPSQSVGIRFDESQDAQLSEEPKNESHHLGDESKKYSHPKPRDGKSKNSSLPREPDDKYSQRVDAYSKNDSADVIFLDQVKPLSSVGSRNQEKVMKITSGSYRPALSSDGSSAEVRRERASRNMTAIVPHKSLLSDELPLCPPVPPDLEGPIKVDVSAANLLEEESRHPELLPGGRWRPPDCRSRHKVAVIVPYRARAESLAILLRHLHPFMQRQQLDYGIFVVEQAGSGKFNRAMLLNVGALESLKLYSYRCFIFHDIDLLAEDDRNLYSCPEQPRHMSVAIDTMHYQLPYNDIFGGVSALSLEHMRKVNGFSNKFWGWGGEDDDMSNRLKFYGLFISRYPANIARYTMLNHKKEPPNPQRYQTLYAGKKRFKMDGLNSIQYRVLDVQLRKLFTWIYVELQKS